MMRSIKSRTSSLSGNHAFGLELAERDLQSRALPGDLVHAVELEVEQLADTQSAGAL